MSQQERCACGHGKSQHVSGQSKCGVQVGFKRLCVCVEFFPSPVPLSDLRQPLEGPKPVNDAVSLPASVVSDKAEAGPPFVLQRHLGHFRIVSTKIVGVDWTTEDGQEAELLFQKFSQTYRSAFLAGSSSRDADVERLKKENERLRERLKCPDCGGMGIYSTPGPNNEPIPNPCESCSATGNIDHAEDAALSVGSVSEDTIDKTKGVR